MPSRLNDRVSTTLLKTLLRAAILARARAPVKITEAMNHFASRLQIQEELVQQIGNYIQETTAPRGLAVRISAVHMCKTHRGVHASHLSRMVTNAWFGEMKTDQALAASVSCSSGKSQTWTRAF